MGARSFGSLKLLLLAVVIVAGAVILSVINAAAQHSDSVDYGEVSPYDPAMAAAMFLYNNAYAEGFYLLLEQSNAMRMEVGLPTHNPMNYYWINYYAMPWVLTGQ